MAIASISEQGLKGKKGPNVYYSVEGITYVRQYVRPDHSKPSELQLAGWSKFKVANRFAGPLREAFNLGFINYRKGMRSPAKVGLGLLLKKAFRDGLPEPDPALVQISAGSLTGMENGKVDRSDGQHVLVQWDNNTGTGNAAGRDRVSLLLYDVLHQKAFFMAEGNPRSAGQQEFHVPYAEKHLGNLHVYAFFTFKNPVNQNHQVSDSTYLGLI
ncbi:DUF6266 family protein [Anditalea andensis]|uniref:Uncharacterized protein n=1 Tax=Anditalea andensis TaxID=1048983 RepID=A0A074L398_9BACT|nr:DUF6266 family protein [Anditalea andensis]KEO75619.1 hypothetical protein EL17_00585 [Anditalea andensis]